MLFPRLKSIKIQYILLALITIYLGSCLGIGGKGAIWYSKRFAEYNLTSDVLTIKKNMPFGGNLDSMAVTSFDNNIYAIQTVRKYFAVFDPNQDEWKRLPEVPAPEIRSMYSDILYRGTILFEYNTSLYYMIYNYSDLDNILLYRFDIALEEWSERKGLDSVHAAHPIISDSGIFVLSENGNVFCYDEIGDGWNGLAQCPDQALTRFCCTIENSNYLFSFSENGWEQYDITLDSWINGGNIPAGANDFSVFYNTGISVENEVYIFSITDDYLYMQLQVFNINTGNWNTIFTDVPSIRFPVILRHDNFIYCFSINSYTAGESCAKIYKVDVSDQSYSTIPNKFVEAAYDTSLVHLLVCEDSIYLLGGW